MMSKLNWEISPSRLTLRPDTIHLWFASLHLNEEITDQYYSLLSEDEKLRARRFYFPKDRHYFIQARGILRDLLSRYLLLKSNEIQFLYQSFGKPYLQEQRLQFNVSHSGDIALYIFGVANEVGVDVEYLGREVNPKDLGQRFFSKEEYERMCVLPEETLKLGFFKTWTQKEAFVKALGEGLRFSLSRFSVEGHPEYEGKLLSVDGDEQVVEAWTLKSFIPEENYFGAYACHFTPEVVRCYKYSK